jgi:hypothetical protein
MALRALSTVSIMEVARKIRPATPTAPRPLALAANWLR